MSEGCPRLIINSSGTSIVTNFGKKEFLKELDSYDFNEWENIKPIRRQMEKELLKSDRLAKCIAEQRWKKICAEINPLYSLNIDPGKDEIILLTTQTNSGRFCAEMVCKIAKEKLGWRMSYRFIPDLQINDSKRFERYGVRNYLEEIIKLYDENRYQKEIVLIPTGGYKGVVPYTALLGMIFKLKMYYIFEDSITLLELPWLPVDFDYELLDNIIDKLQRIENETAVDVGYFWDGIDYYEKSRYMPLIYEEDGKIIFSGVGFLLWEKYKQTFPPELKKDNTPPDKKKIKLADTHHGNDKLMKLARRLVNTPYVMAVINSAEHKPKRKNFISDITDDGKMTVTLTYTDKGYSMVIQTTGRNKKETEAIADWLRKKFKL